MKKKIKQQVKLLDNKYFGGKLKKIYKKLRRIGAEQLYNIEGYLHRKYRDGKIVYDGEVALRDIILSQYHYDDYENYRFVNGVVELIAIENYYGSNEFGFDYYKKMQEDSYFEWEKRFKNLIKSYEVNGYDGKHYVQLAKDFAVMDGSHRIMLAWYHGMEFIWGKVYQTERDRPFNIDFFWEKGLGYKDCKYIEQRKEKLLEDANYDYTGVIWPPAYDYADMILEDIENHGDGVHIVEKETLEYEKEDFIGLFKGLYHTDILDEDGMKFKLRLLDNSMVQHDVYRIMRFKMKCNNPRMSMNSKNYMPQSETVSRIKQWVRRRYRESIMNYEYDVIMHISDNYLQSKFCEILFQIDKDLSTLFCKLDVFDYAVTRIENVDSQHFNFPYTFYYRSNCNIFINSVQKECFISEIYNYCCDKYNHPWMKIDTVIENENTCIKLMIRDYMFFQFEVADFMPGTKDSFVLDAISVTEYSRQMKVLEKKYELIVRSMAYIKNPRKKYHLKYIEDNVELLFDATNLRKYLTDSSFKKVEKMFKTQNINI